MKVYSPKEYIQVLPVEEEVYIATCETQYHYSVVAGFKCLLNVLPFYEDWHQKYKKKTTQVGIVYIDVDLPEFVLQALGTISKGNEHATITEKNYSKITVAFLYVFFLLISLNSTLMQMITCASLWKQLMQSINQSD